MIIYGEKISRAERALWAADECEIDYKHIPEPVNGEKSDALLSINPDGAIPTIDDNGYILTQSWAITLYIARKYAQNLASQNDIEEADILRWTFWVACDVESTVIDTIYATGVIPDNDADPERLKANHQTLKRPISALDSWLENKTYITGERFTIGDLNAASAVSWLTMTGFDFTAFPNVQQWVALCMARPKFPVREI